MRENHKGRLELVTWQSRNQISQMSFGSAVVEICDAECDPSWQGRPPNIFMAAAAGLDLEAVNRILGCPGYQLSDAACRLSISRLSAK
jgi:hypothetical protein